MNFSFLFPWTHRSTRRLVYSICILASIVALVLIVVSGLLSLKYIVFLSLIATTLNGILVALYEKPKLGRFACIASYLLIAIILLYSILIISITWEGKRLLGRITSDNSISKQTIDTTKPFNLYISGIDTYGDISTISRSDVNIVATVNPQTKSILLTSIPRDSYVRIAGGGNDQYDKLTHAGIYGVSASTQTVAHLLDTDLTNYVRINFTSFIAIVDKIGGIDVVNPTAFTTDARQTFPVGTLHLNGKDALTFSRERHNLEGGDNDRGINQERVLSAIFNKLSSPSVLQHYSDILNVVGGSIQTNLSEGSLVSIINHQLDNQDTWKISMTSISGKGQTGGLPSYAMPSSQLYMFVLDDTSLQQARSRVHSVLSTGGQ